MNPYEQDSTKRRTGNAFMDAISSGHSKIPRLSTMCAAIIQDLIKDGLEKNFGNTAFLAGVDSACLEIILSKCTPQQLRRVEEIHLNDDVQLDTDGLWEQICYKQWGKASCKNKPSHEDWKDYYQDRLLKEQDQVEMAKRKLLKAKEAEASKKKKELKSISLHNEPTNVTKKVTINRQTRDSDGRRMNRQITTVVKQPVRRRTNTSSPSASSSSSTLGKKSALWAKAERDMATSKHTSTIPKMTERPTGIMGAPKRQPDLHMVSSTLDEAPKVIRRPIVINPPKKIDLSRTRAPSPDRFDGVEPSPVTPRDLDRIFGSKNYANASSKRFGSLKKENDSMTSKRAAPTGNLAPPSKRPRADGPTASSSSSSTKSSLTSSIRSTEFGSIKIPKKR